MLEIVKVQEREADCKCGCEAKAGDPVHKGRVSLSHYNRKRKWGTRSRRHSHGYEKSYKDRNVKWPVGLW